MRRAPKNQLVSGSLYRTVAMLAVGLAVLVALFGTANRDAASMAPSATAIKPAPPQSTSSMIEPVDAPVESQEPGDPVPDQGQGPDPAPHEAAGSPGPDVRAAGPARPTPAQVAHLIEQSRIRSGANPGGD